MPVANSWERKDAVKALIAAGSGMDNDCLPEACRGGSAAVVQNLLDAGARVNPVDDEIKKENDDEPLDIELGYAEIVNSWSLIVPMSFCWSQSANGTQSSSAMWPHRSSEAASFRWNCNQVCQ